MTGRHLLLTAAVLSLPASLGGCVAAAIPVLAAGGLVVRDDKPDSAPDQIEPIVEVQPKVEAPLATVPAQQLAVEPGTAAPVMELPPVDQPGSDTQALAAPAPAVSAVAATSSASATGQLEAAQRVNPYAAFYRHAAEQARLDPVAAPRSSAVLAAPGSLQPVMSDCAILPPAVVVDLDPATGRVPLGAPFAANPDLAEVLAALRVQNVAVFWISANSAADAGRVRERLLESGLDPWGRDGLLLMRRAEDRKDARRRELSETHCVSAIAGDSRSDFDELFDFLRNPAAAAPLEPLLGAGWFLTPPPVTAKEG